MGGSGGGASGTVSYPAYIQAFHTAILDHGGTDSPDNSFIEAFNIAYGNSPFAGAVANDPSTDLAAAVTGVNGLNTLISVLNYTADFPTALAVARTNFPLGTTSLDSTALPTTLPPYTPTTVIVGASPSTLDTSALDTTTLDSLSVAQGEIDADVAAMNQLLTEQLEQEGLVRYRAGMLNINAIHSSAYIIGEALLRAAKDRTLAKYATDLQLKTNEQVREINAKHTLSYREITARLQTSQKEINARHAMSFRELNLRDSITTKEINARHLLGILQTLDKHQELYREDILKLQISQMELDARHKISKRDIEAKFYLHREEVVRMATVNMLGDLMKKVEFTYQAAHLNSEIRRLSIVSKKEQIDEQLSIDEGDAKWDLELFRHAGIILAAPSGGVAQGNDKKSRAVSALAGGISGAAAGAATGAAIGAGGGPWGAAIGAVAGVGLALLS